MNFWNRLDGRERLLISIAGFLVAILALWFLGIRPIMSAKANALNAQTMAIRDLEIVQTNLPKLSGKSASATGTQTFDRSAVLRLAKANQLTVSRVQPENNGSLKFWFEDAPSTQIFKLMSELSSDYAVTIGAVQMSRKDNGTVSATLTLEPRA